MCLKRPSLSHSCNGRARRTEQRNRTNLSVWLCGHGQQQRLNRLIRAHTSVVRIDFIFLHGFEHFFVLFDIKRGFIRILVLFFLRLPVQANRFRVVPISLSYNFFFLLCALAKSLGLRSDCACVCCAYICIDEAVVLQAKKKKFRV